MVVNTPCTLLLAQLSLLVGYVSFSYMHALTGVYGKSVTLGRVMSENSEVIMSILF